MRKTYIDIAKGIGILLVILGHMNRFFSYEGRLNQIVYSVQLPVFLIIGGYWMRLKAGESPLAFAAGKFYRLMQPYFLFAFFSIIYAWPKDAGEFGYYVAGALWGIGICDYLPNLPIWFLTMFFVANLWFYLVLLAGKLGRKWRQSAALESLGTVLLIYAGWRIKLREVRLPWGFELAMIMQGFFLAGHFWRLAEEKLKRSPVPEKKKKAALLTLALPAFFIWLVCVRWNGRVDINAAWFGNKGLWSFYLAALCGSYLVILLSAVLAKCPPIAWALSLFGKNSMVIMAVHVPVLLWLDGVVTPLMPAIIQANQLTKNWIGVTYHFAGIALLSLFDALLLKKNPYGKGIEKKAGPVEKSLEKD